MAVARFNKRIALILRVLSAYSNCSVCVKAPVFWTAAAKQASQAIALISVTFYS